MIQLENSRSRGSDTFQEAQSRAKRRAQQEAQRQADVFKEELGEMLFDALEDYFPSQAQQRRRQSGKKMLLLGIAVGILIRHLASQR